MNPHALRRQNLNSANVLTLQPSSENISQDKAETEGESAKLGIEATANENPGALAGATGANKENETGKSLQHDTPRSVLAAMAKIGKPSHKAISRALYYTLTLSEFWAWAGFRFILMARLSRVERAALAYAVLSSLDDDDSYMVASLVLYGDEIEARDHAQN
ncbi:hypothetical protein KZZ08_02325 [Roseovarius mucosus]|uniref:hypothetical protein n=1 Tax=Roseovarius mucosus TaxID=215743 RepID=UPI001C5E381C|nr:hypothetical protein [Roseovarius mucosus]MBW4972433.1 hypothetical protein [Roseovarius mucosus]